MAWTKNEALPLPDSFIVWSTILILVLAPVLRGGVDTASLCLIAAIIATSFFLFLGKTILKNTPLKFSGLEIPLLLLACLGVISSFPSLYPAQSLRVLGFFCLCGAFFFLIQNSFLERTRLYHLVLAIVISGIVLSIFGLFKYVIFMGTTSWKEGLNATHVNRNHFAGYVGLCLPLAIGLIGYVADKGKKALLVYGVALMALALVLSLSRGGWISTGVALLVMALLAKKRGLLSKKMGAVAAVVFILVFASLLGLNSVSERISSAGQALKDPVNLETRIKVWKGTLQIIQDHPLWGTGLGTYAYSFPPFRAAGIRNRYTAAHNDFLHFTSELGLLFLPLFFWLVFSAVKIGLTIFFNTRSALKRGVSLGCTIGILTIVIHSLFDFNLQIPANTLLFFSYMGILGALKKTYGQPKSHG